MGNKFTHPGVILETILAFTINNSLVYIYLILFCKNTLRKNMCMKTSHVKRKFFARVDPDILFTIKEGY